MRAVTQILTKAVRTPAKAVTVKIAKRNYSSEPTKKTLLNGLHRELGAKMVPFAGWDMPVQYPLGVLKEHTHTREKAGLFDVSHMGQLKITGKDRYKFIERLTVADIINLPVGTATLSVITNENGGIIDDTIITNKGDHIYVVINAGCFDKDYAHIMAQLDQFKKQGHQVDIQLLSNEYSLLALQGPSAEAVLSKLTNDDVASLKFMTGKPIKLAGADCYAQRSGYTGEDGFEIAIPNPVIEKVARQMLSNSEVQFIGLGARDSLRLEAGMCLYGHELNETITPKQAGLSWVVAKRRREEGGFLGAETILKELKNEKPVTSLRVGMLIEGSPARENATVHDPASGKQIGHVTSGTFSPILKKAIAMGYVDTAYSKADTPVHVQVRGKMVPSKIVKLPFVPTKYKK